MIFDFWIVFFFQTGVVHFLGNLQEQLVLDCLLFEDRSVQYFSELSRAVIFELSSTVFADRSGPFFMELSRAVIFLLSSFFRQEWYIF